MLSEEFIRFNMTKARVCAKCHSLAFYFKAKIINSELYLRRTGHGLLSVRRDDQAR